MAHAADPYGDIDFDEITEKTGLAPDEIKCLKVSKQNMYGLKGEKLSFMSVCAKKQYNLHITENRSNGTSVQHNHKWIVLLILFFQVCFDLFDTKKVEFLSADDLGEIMRAMGFRPTEEELKDLLAEIDEDGSGEIEFAEFCQLCATFLVEDPDMETMKRELKDAFR